MQGHAPLLVALVIAQQEQLSVTAMARPPQDNHHWRGHVPLCVQDAKNLWLENPALQKKLNALGVQIQFDQQVVHKFMDENAQLKLEVGQLQMKLQAQKDSVKLSLSRDVNEEADSPTPTARTPSTIPHFLRLTRDFRASSN